MRTSSAENPSALLEVFLIMAGREDNAGGAAHRPSAGCATACCLIDERLPQRSPENTRLFMELLRAPHTLVTQLGRMRRYGVLGRYIPEFGRVIGQMQHDLFHIYTVDAHTMMVVRFMQRFTRRGIREAIFRWPAAGRRPELPKIELLYIAGLFHDIGKGRGGDHSNLGADDVVGFLQRRHGLSRRRDGPARFPGAFAPGDVDHGTAQGHQRPGGGRRLRPDWFRTEERLNYLYALTVADINATNPNLWNDWRSTLLRQLYGATLELLGQGPEARVSRHAEIEQRQREAEAVLLGRDLHPAAFATVWRGAGDGFFLEHTPEEVAWLTERVVELQGDAEQIVLVTDVKSGDIGKGATEVFVCMPDRENLFADSVMALDRLRLQIVNARIATGDDGRCYDSFVVLDENGRAVADSGRRETIRQRLLKVLSQQQPVKQRPSRRIPRALKHFAIPTEVDLGKPDGRGISELAVVTTDRPGLLAEIGSIFVELDIEVHQARISTLGERIEDIFRISGKGRRPIDEPGAIGNIRAVLTERLDAMIRDGVR